MHYWIDGYNLLFRFKRTHPDSDLDLQRARQFILEELNEKVSCVQIEVSIVFDATWQIGEGSRSHLGALEILFTAEGETADEYILDEISHLSDPRQETLVTSDKKLASQARSYRAHTQTVEEFILWLNRLYKNRLRGKKKGKGVSLPVSAPLLPPSLPSNKTVPLEGSLEAYAAIFEERARHLLEQEETEKQLAATPPKKKPRRPKRRKDPFEKDLKEESEFKTNEERWLKAFERKLIDEGRNSDI